MDLTDKKILLIIPSFYGYETFIKEELEKFGATVSLLENRAFRNDPVTVGTKWYSTIFCKKNKYIKKRLIPQSKDTFDICLFINLFSFDPKIIENLKYKSPNIVSVLYLWDNVKGYHWQQFFRFFDKIYSFDPVESRKLGLNYLPNYYPATPPVSPIEKNKFDLSFVGSLQMHRLKALKVLATTLTHQNKSFYFHLYLHPNYNRLKYNTYIHTFLNILPGQFKGYKKLYDLIAEKNECNLIRHDPLTILQTVQSMVNSRCVLDLPVPSQTGSTQRVIQALALQKKIITTNPTIAEESFYDPDYIKIVSPENIAIDWDWVNRKNEKKLDINHLRLDNWLAQLLEI